MDLKKFEEKYKELIKIDYMLQIKELNDKLDDLFIELKDSKSKTNRYFLCKKYVMTTESIFKIKKELEQEKKGEENDKFVNA